MHGTESLLTQGLAPSYSFCMQEAGQILSQQQKAVMTPQLIQSLNLMALPLADLREKILEEAENNPALEILSDPAVVRESALPEKFSPDSGSAPAFSAVRSGGGEAADANRSFLEKVLSRQETLQEHLDTGLSEISLPPETGNLARLIIHNLDANGFHRCDPALLPGGGNPETLKAALQAVRSLDPPGCAASGPLESLAIQAEIFAGAPETGETGRKLFSVLASVFRTPEQIPLLQTEDPAALSRALKRKTGIALTESEAAQLPDFLRSLQPFPGRMYPSGSTADGTENRYITPDVLVRRKNGRFLVKINEEEIPVAGISPFFAGLGSDRTQDSSTHKFVRTSLKDAEWFLSSLKRRNRTILNVTRAIVLRQRDFFMRGPKFLHPMRLQEIAGDTDLHEATVSRAAAGKYLQCEWGIFPLKYFFSGKAGAGKTRPENGGGSKESVKEILRGMLAGTEKKTSDRELAEKLAAQGIRIARRTVAKYRAELESGFRR